MCFNLEEQELLEDVVHNSSNTPQQQDVSQ